MDANKWWSKENMQLQKMNSREGKKKYLSWLEEEKLEEMKRNEWGALNDKRERMQVWRVLGVFSVSKAKFRERREFETVEFRCHWC